MRYRFDINTYALHDVSKYTRDWIQSGRFGHERAYFYIGDTRYPIEDLFCFEPILHCTKRNTYKGYKIYNKFTYSANILGRVCIGPTLWTVDAGTDRELSKHKKFLFYGFKNRTVCAGGEISKAFDVDKYNDAVHILLPFINKVNPIQYVIRQCKYGNDYVLRLRNYYVYFRLILYYDNCIDSYCIDMFITDAHTQHTPPAYKMHKGKVVEYVLGDVLLSFLQKKGLKYHVYNTPDIHYDEQDFYSIWYNPKHTTP